MAPLVSGVVPTSARAAAALHSNTPDAPITLSSFMMSSSLPRTPTEPSGPLGGEPFPFDTGRYGHPTVGHKAADRVAAEPWGAVFLADQLRFPRAAPTRSSMMWG